MKLGRKYRGGRGFTLIELTVVITTLLVLLAAGMATSYSFKDWKLGRDASETLRNVYVAQRTYLSDNPTALVSSLTEALLLPYLPGSPAAFPQVTALDGASYSIQVSVSPPVIVDAEGGVYDPSSSPNDSLWDLGN